MVSPPESKIALDLGGIPIGIDPDARYTGRRPWSWLPATDSLVYSDGIVEQRNKNGESFGAPRLRDAVRGIATPSQDITRLFLELERFAGGLMLDDDATATAVGLVGTSPQTDRAG